MKMSEILSHIEYVVKGNKVPILKGGTGIGKSATVRQLVDKLADGRKVVDSLNPKDDEYGFIDYRLCFLDTHDLGGLPYLASSDESDTVKVQRRALLDNLPKSGEGILFLDEIAQANMNVIALVAQLIGDRQMGDYKLPDGWRLILACNRVSDFAASKRLPQQVMQRLSVWDCDAEFDDWERWGTENKVHPYVMGYLSFQPQALNVFDAKVDDAQANPRSWTYLSDVLKTGAPKDKWRALAKSFVGEGVATEFRCFIDLIDKVPNISNVLNGVETEPPIEGGVCYLTLVTLMEQIEQASSEKIYKWFDNVVPYAEKMHCADMGIFFVNNLTAKRPELKETSTYSQWKIKHQHIEY